MKTVYGVYVDRSEDGRGPNNLLALFEKSTDAEMVAAKNEPYGHFGQFTSIRELKLFSTKADYDAEVLQETRRRALGKLDDNERKALGL